MTQNTNSAASLKLQPNKSNNIGNMIKEYIRYNRKYEEDKIAKKNIEKAREAEFNFKINGRRDKLLEALRPDDTVGYFNSQIIEAYDKNQDKLFELSQKASKGDKGAMMLYQKELTKWTNLSNAGKAFKEKIASNTEARKTGGFNSIIDESYIDFEKSLINGAINLNPETLETTILTSNGEDVVLPASKITSNEFFTHQFGVPADFQGSKKYGTALINDIYVKNPNISDADALILGLKGVRNLFATDQNEKVTWYGTVLKEEGKDPRKEYPFDKQPLKRRNEIMKKYLNRTTFRPEKSIKEKQAEANLKGKNISNAIQIKNLKKLDNTTTKKDNTLTKIQISANSLRTSVDGARAGNEEYLLSLKGQKLREQGNNDVYIEDVEYSNGIITIYKTGGKTQKIDTSKESSISEISKLFRPSDKVDLIKEEYNRGKSSVEFKKNSGSIRNIERFKKSLINVSTDGSKSFYRDASEFIDGLVFNDDGIDKITYKGIEYSDAYLAKNDLEDLKNRILEHELGNDNGFDPTKF